MWSSRCEWRDLFRHPHRSMRIRPTIEKTTTTLFAPADDVMKACSRKRLTQPWATSIANLVIRSIRTFFWLFIQPIVLSRGLRDPNNNILFAKNNLPPMTGPSQTGEWNIGCPPSQLDIEEDLEEMTVTGAAQRQVKSAHNCRSPRGKWEKYWCAPSR